MRRARFALLVLSLGVRAGLAQTIPIWTQSIAPCPIVAVVVGPDAPGSAVLPPCGTRDFKSHTVTMVGRNPFLHGHIKTGIKTQLVSVKLLFANAGPTYDPTVATSRLVDINGVKLSVEDATNDSPIFQNATWKMNGVDVGSGVTGGALQYGDAFQRANFWRYVGGTPHQTVLTPLDLRATAVINVPAGMGVSMANCNGNKALGPCGLAALGWWDPVAQGIIANPANNIGPDTFVIFIFDSVQLYLNTISVLAGYHSSFTDRNGFTRTYAVADFDTSGVLAKTAPDVMVLSHEVGEWMDDPVIDTPTVKSGEGGEGGNQVAGWGPYGQQTGCQTNLEVGDPSSQPTPKPPPVKGPITPKPFVMMLNNFKYHLQELNYFSWFLGANAGNPSIAVANGFSNNGSFTTDAGLVCK